MVRFGGFEYVDDLFDSFVFELVQTLMIDARPVGLVVCGIERMDAIRGDRCRCRDSQWAQLNLLGEDERFEQGLFGVGRSREKMATVDLRSIFCRVREENGHLRAGCTYASSSIVHTDASLIVAEDRHHVKDGKIAILGQVLQQATACLQSSVGTRRWALKYLSEVQFLLSVPQLIFSGKGFQPRCL